MTNKPIEQAVSDEASRFVKLARALFRVDKKDVPKHEPKKREKQANIKAVPP